MAEGSSLLKNGNKVLIDNQPYLILENEFVNPGKGQAFTRIKIKNLMLHAYKIKFMINNIQYNFKAKYNNIFEEFLKKNF